MKRNTQRFEKRRRFVMVLPLLVTPFLTMIFWALGGGQGTASYGMEEKNAGLNLELPNAQFRKDDNAWDKLSLYQKAQRDSIKHQEALRNDPYFKLQHLKVAKDTSKRPNGVNPSLGNDMSNLDENERRVNERLNELYKNLNVTEHKRKPRYDPQGHSEQPGSFGHDVEKLQSMMEMMQSGDAESAEMKEIQTVLDKILDIQHPERVKERSELSGSTTSSKYFSVSSSEKALIDSAMSPSIQNRFYGVNDHASVENAPAAIEAEIYDAQTIVSGSIVKLRLVNDIYVNGVLVPKDHFIFGTSALNGERLTVTINAIRNGAAIYPVSLSVFDLDGLEGIHIPGAIARDVAKQSSNQAVQDIQLNSMNPSLEVQAATTGIEAVKNLMSKKTRLIKVSLKAGYKVLLIDTNSDNN